MERTYPYGTGVVKWVSTEWLAGNLGSDQIMLIDTQPDVHDYIKRHIPGAVFMHEGLMRCPMNGTPAYYIPAEAVQMIFRRVGLRNELPAVVYTGSGGFKGWGDGLEQTMIAYSLARFGHKNVYILDGGLDKWVEEDRSLTKEFPIVQQSDFEVNVDESLFVEYDEFAQMLGRDDVMVLDVRPANMYEGQGPWNKPGHIPGAVNMPWQSLMDKKNKRLLKPHEELEDILAEHQVGRDQMIYVSCGTGREATNVMCLLKWYFHFPGVRLYEGSFTEWVALDNPTVTGKMPYEKAIAAEGA